jgi:hypothetical protein
MIDAALKRRSFMVAMKAVATTTVAATLVLVVLRRFLM